MSSLYDGSRPCVRLGSILGGYFEVRRELRQWYVKSPWFFNVSFNRRVRMVNKRATGRGVKLREENGVG